MKLKNNHTIFYTILIVSLLVFLMTTTFSLYIELSLVDDWVANLISTLSNSIIFQVIEQTSLFGSVEFVFFISIVLVGIFIYWKDWRTTFFYSFLTGGGIVLNYILKIIFQRTRPGEERLISFFNYEFELASYSFPSGHTMRATLLFVFLIYFVWRIPLRKWLSVSLTLLAAAIIIGVGLSRIISDAHFFTDILAAISISVFWFTGLLLIFKRRSKNNNMREKAAQ